MSYDSERQPPTILRALVASLVHRIDAWGVALIVALLALVLHDAVRPGTLLLAALVTFSYWLAYTVNDFFDAPFDAQEPSKARNNLFVRCAVSRRRAAAGLVVFAGLLLLAFSNFGRKGVLGCAVFLAVAWAYSAPPVRLKSRPGIDLLTHALFVQTYPYFLCLILIDAVWTALDFVLLAVNFLASLSGQLAQQVRDFGVDSKTDVNFATTAGRRWTVLALGIVTSTLVAVVAIGLLTRTLPALFIPLAAAFLPTALHRIRGHRGERPLVVFSTSVAILYAAALVAHTLYRIH